MPVQSYWFFFVTLMKIKRRVPVLTRASIIKELIDMALVPGKRGEEAFLILESFATNLH